MRLRDVEDGQWWHNLRFTLCMLRRGLSKDELARGVLVVYIISPSPEPYDVHRCCMEAAACLSPPSTDDPPLHPPLHTAMHASVPQPPKSDLPPNPSTTQPPSDAASQPSATQPQPDMPPHAPAVQPPSDADTRPSAPELPSDVLMNPPTTKPTPDTEPLHPRLGVAMQPSALQPPPNAPTNPLSMQPPSQRLQPQVNPQLPSGTNGNIPAAQPASEAATSWPPAAASSQPRASQPSPPQSVPPPPAAAGAQTAAAAAAAAAAWCGSSFRVEAASASGPSFRVYDASLPVAGLLVQVLLPFALHDPTSSCMRATALTVCNSMHQGLRAPRMKAHVMMD